GGFSSGGGQSGETIGITNLTFTPVEIVELLIMLLVVVYLFVALVALVAVYARTAKEANTYVMPLMIVVMLGSIMTMFSGSTAKGIQNFAVPIYNTAISIQNLLVGELTLAQFGLTIGSTAILAAIITVLITKAFSSEKVMFNA
ncbi:MAG TPA: ABC transporter permease, partial [Mobilitalea sp.]|nr:ABC transporter permease [Mobilitalea sp.]